MMDRITLTAVLTLVPILTQRQFAASEDLAADAPLVKRLRAPMVTVIEGQSLRGAVDEIAASAGLTVWIDRDIDPSAPLNLGQVGPTVFHVLQRVAAERGGEIFPLRGVVLLGRRDRVDRTASSLRRLDLPRETDPVEIAWPDVTTPTEALSIAAGRHLVTDSLPHDLWPAVRWNGLPRSVAMTLVVAQFDQRLRRVPDRPRRQPSDQTAGSRPHVELEAAGATGTWERRYPQLPSTGDRSLSRWRRTIRQADPEAQVSRAGGGVLVRATTAAHRIATQSWLDEAGPRKSPEKQEKTTSRFTLQLKNKPAGQVLQQLAAAAGKDCQIEPEAATASDTLVSLQAEDATLAELAQRVADQAGLVVTWADPVVVSQ